MKRILLAIAVLAVLGGSANAQILRNLRDRAKNAAENKVGEKVEQSVNDAFNEIFGNKKEAQEQAAPAQKQEAVVEQQAEKPAGQPAAKPQEDVKQKKQVATAYAKTDFVPGDEIFFDDPVEGEKLGEFPLHWDFLGGEECEVMTIDGRQAIKLSG